MKPTTCLVYCSLFLILAVSPQELVLSQAKDKIPLEKQVTLLEERVKVLEARISMMIGGKGEEIRKVNRIMLQDFTNIARLVHEYYLRSSTDAAHPKSYRGVVLPPRVMQTELATYLVTARDTEAVLEGKPVALLGTMSARIGTDGKPKDWTYTGDFVAAHDYGLSTSSGADGMWETFNHEISYIAALAHAYFERPRSTGGGGGTYTGFVLPREQAMTQFGRYRIIANDTTLIIEGISPSASVIKRVFVDRGGSIVKTVTNNFGGLMRKPVIGIKSIADSVRETITQDFTTIAARAQEYRKRPIDQGGGGGKYKGYLSAQVGSVDGLADYQVDVADDRIILNATTKQGLGTMGATIDSNGRLCGWFYTGELSK